jgi:creatinine amidohydrolase
VSDLRRSAGVRTAGELSWPAFQERLRAGAPLVLSVGAFEQHGPHLPLATDSLIAARLAEAVATRVGGLALPTLPYGAPSRPRSGGGERFPAPALTLPTLLAAVESLAEGALRAGAHAVLVISWHLENAAVLWDALRGPLERWGAGENAVQPRNTPRGPLAGRDTGRGPSERADGPRALLFEAPWELLGQELEREVFPEGAALWPADHAGRLETALVRHLAPELVGDPPAPVAFSPRAGYDVLPTPADAVPATGVALDARAVDADLGERCFQAMVAGIAAAAAAELWPAAPWLRRWARGPDTR